MSLITLAAIGYRTTLDEDYHPGAGSMTCVPGGGGYWGAASVSVPMYLLAVKADSEDTHYPVQTVYEVTGSDADVLSGVTAVEGEDQFFAAGSVLKLCTDTGTGGNVGPYALPAFTSFLITGQATIIEVGAAIADGDHTFTWSTSNAANVQTNSIGIADSTAGTDLATGLANDGSEVIAFAAPITNTSQATNVWTITGTNTHGGLFSRTFAVNWLWKIYAGTSATATLDAAGIAALSDFAGLKADFPGDYACSTGDYKYLAYPDVMGDVTNFIDPATGFPIGMADAADNAAYSHVQANGWSYALVSVTNAQAVAANYRVFRTHNPIGSPLTLRVS